MTKKLLQDSSGYVIIPNASFQLSRIIPESPTQVSQIQIESCGLPYRLPNHLITKESGFSTCFRLISADWFLATLRDKFYMFNAIFD